MKIVAKQYIGVDISKNKLDIHILPSNKFLTIPNKEDDIQKFINELSQYDVLQVACEATGGYEKLLKQQLKKYSYDLWIIDPRRIKGFITATGCKTKTDKIDARKIAEFASKNTKDYDAIDKTENQVLLQALVDRKNDLTKILASEKTRLEQPSHALSVPSIQKLIKILLVEIKAIKKKIDALFKKDNQLGHKATILESIPGIATATAAVLVSHLPELGIISNSKISALVGLCPYNNESGKRKGKRSIRGGRMTPRNALYMCALTAISYNPTLKSFYNRLRIEKQKPFKVAIVAVMHKLIILANSLLKKGELCKI